MGQVLRGGIPFKGNVFKITLDGTGLQVLHTFTGTNDGAFPHTPLLETSDHVLYGLTFQSGVSNRGTIFRLNLDGTGYTVVRSFLGAPFDGSFPSCGLVQRNNGLLYGATQSGGTGVGTIFQLNPDGTAYAIAHNFTSSVGNVQSLAQTADGRLYGGTWAGGGMQLGTLFSIDPAPFLMPLKLWSDHTEVRLTGIPGRTCRIEVCSSLPGPWTVLGSVAIGPNGNAVYNDALHPVSAFYRVLYP